MSGWINFWHGLTSGQGTLLGGAFVDERDGSGVVNRRRRVRHADDGRDPAARGGGDPGGNIFFRRLAGFAEMDVQVNQAGADNFSRNIEARYILRRLGGKIFADGGDFSIENQNIRDGVEIIGGVNDAPAGEEQRIHARSLTARD